jgi:putative peptidoglycan lipid II flippase
VESRHWHMARNAVLVGGLFGLASIAGLFRNILIARQFGIGADLDAYYAAFKLPDLLFTVVAGGALATAFVPLLAQFLAHEDLEGAWRLTSAVTNLVLLVVISLATVAILAAPWLVRTFIAPGFETDVQAETAALMRLVLVSTVVFSISAVLGSVLHGFKHFFLPALSPVMYPLAVIASALWLVPLWGVRGLAVGAIAGSVLHLAVKVPGLLHYGFRWRWVLGLGSPSLRRVLVLMAPRVLDLGVFHLTILATGNLASRLAAGSVSALEWGWDFMQLPETMIGTAFGVVALPTLSELAARRDVSGMRSTLGETLRAALALTVPAAAMLILLGRPLVQGLYQRGAFDLTSTEAVLSPLRFYALGLVGHSCLELAARAFFAQQDTVTPLLIAIGSAAANVLLAVLLMDSLGAGGLALANSLAVTIEVLVLLLLLGRRWGGVEARITVGAAVRVGAATLAMSLVLAVMLSYAQRVGWGPLATLALGGVSGAITYVVAGWLSGVQILRRIFEASGLTFMSPVKGPFSSQRRNRSGPGGNGLERP